MRPALLALVLAAACSRPTEPPAATTTPTSMTSSTPEMTTPAPSCVFDGDVFAGDVAVTGARVVIDGRAVFTDDAGRFHDERAVDDPRRVLARTNVVAAGYVSRHLMMSCGKSKHVKLDPSTFTLRGVVKSSKGAALSDAVVSVDQAEQPVQPDGSFALELNRRGALVHVSAPHHQSQDREIGDPAQPMEVTLAPETLVTGFIRDRQGRPLAMVSPSCLDARGPTNRCENADAAGSDVDGHYALRVPPGEPITVTAVANHGYGRAGPVTVVAAHSAALDIVVDAGRRVQGTTNLPRRLVQVQVHFDDDDWADDDVRVEDNAFDAVLPDLPLRLEATIGDDTWWADVPAGGALANARITFRTKR